MEEREMRTFDLSRQERSSVLEGIAKELAGRKEILFAYAHGSFLGKVPSETWTLQSTCTPK